MAITTELPTEFVYTILAMASWVANQIRTSVGCGFRRSVIPPRFYKLEPTNIRFIFTFLSSTHLFGFLCVSPLSIIIIYVTLINQG